MRTLLISIFVFAVLISYSSTVFAQKRSLQLDPYYPTTAVLPTRSITLSPGVTRPPGRTSPIEFCNALRAMYNNSDLGRLDTDPDGFYYIYPHADFVQTNPNNFVLNRLKQDTHFSNIQNDATRQGAAQEIYDALMERVNRDPAFRGSIADQARELGFENPGPTDPVMFYALIHKALDYTTDNNKYFDEIIGFVDRVFQQYQLPKFPFLITNTNKSVYDPTPGRTVVNHYPSAPDWHIGMNMLGCAPDRPRFVYSASPVIHLYPEKEQKITVSFPYNNAITTAFPQYSLKHGFEIIANPKGELFDNLNNKLVQSYLYYEFAADQEKFSNKEPFAVVEGKNIHEFMYSILVPKLQLTKDEAQTYKEDIEKSLPQIDEKQYYKVIVWQNYNLETLWPVTINPKPQTVIRNMVVLKPSDDKPYVSSFSLKQTARLGFTVVENGFLVFPKD